jgi:hypothetical protein
MQSSARFLQLQLQDPETDAHQLLTITRELASTLDRQSGITASLAEGNPQPGKKGDPQAIGAVLLQLASSGGVIVSLIGALKTWFERKPTLDVELQRADGARLKLRAENLKSDEFERLRKQLDSFIGGEPCQSSGMQS